MEKRARLGKSGLKAFGSCKALVRYGKAHVRRGTGAAPPPPAARPSQPVVRGELKIRGYSAYLHPVGEGLLLGVGQDASERGLQLGTQLSLFDVSDPGRPRRLHQAAVANSTSTAEFDHHAFLWWAPRDLAVVPLATYGDEFFQGAAGFRVRRGPGIEEAGRASHDNAPILRSFVAAGRLFTLSDAGLEVDSLDTLAEQAWLPFPPP